ncbi:hypothetical protein G9A89_023231 [Geosiphon pyriformis]|nr:hypothetical protein G9A89_023231 [Geosiphon pyriformis]
MAAMKKSVKDFSKNTVSKDVASKKKRKGGVLKDSVVHGMILSDQPVGGSWGSEAGDTTESDSIDIEGKFLIKKTSVDYGERDVLEEIDSNQMPKSSRLVAKQALGKPLGKINFLGNDDNDNIFLDESVDKLAVVRKLFSKINGFGGASTSSKFSGIIWVTFISESSLMKTTKLAADVKILTVVLKKIPVRTSAETVHTVLSEFGMIKSIKIQLVVHLNWERCDFIGSVGEKTCVIDHHLVTYAWAKCAIVCFESAELLDAIIRTTSVLEDTHFVGSILALLCVQSVRNWVIYLWTVFQCSASVAHSVSFGGVLWAKIVGGSSFPPSPVRNGLVNAGSFLEMKPTLFVMNNLEIRFAVLESSIANFVRQIGELAKRLDLFVLAVSQPSLGCQLSVTPLSQDQVDDVVMGEGLGGATSGNTAAILVSSASFKVKRLENMLEELSASVLSLTARFDDSILTSDFVWKIAMCNIYRMNNLAKQDDVILCISGLDSGYLGAGVAVVMTNSLVKHVCKISEVPGQLIFIRLLFKNKLSVLILGLYAGASLVVRFFQAGDINSLIAKAMNDSSFVILGSNFNEDRSRRCANYKKCFDLGLSNSHDVLKTNNYLFVSLNLVNTIVDHGVADVMDHFDTDHKAVSVSVDLGGLLDVHLISLCKQANKDCWKFNVKNANDTKWLVNAAMFLNEFSSATDGTFKKKWFKSFNSVFTKISFRFHKLELLVSKLVRALCLVFSDDFVFLLEIWDRLDSIGALAVKSLLLLGSNFDVIHSALAKARKLYCSSKLLESKRTEESSIKQVINKRMESFELDKGHTIKGVLEHPFCKVVLDYLVVKNKLILESDLVKPKIDKIMEGWTKKCRMVSDSLDYVFNSVFSGVMCSVSFDKMSAIVKELPDKKTTGLSGISNEFFGYASSAFELLLEGVLTNTHPIALIETVYKILSKVFLDRISSACSTFDVLRKDNFSVLKGMTTQSHIFTIGSVVEDAYDLVGWEHLRRSLVRIKMCNKFIRFFGSIYNGCINRVMTDFGLTDGYHVHNGLDQGEAKLTLFFATGVFVNDTIWVGNSQAAIQYILDIASEFFRFNDISINNDKMVAISINCQIVNSYLTINGSPISIVKKGECHHYLGIFLSTERLSRPSLVKVYSDVWFFANLVLKKVVSDKQFAYLVSAVLFLIVCYRMQFSYVLLNVYNKWDAMICKGLKSKAGLLLNFPNDALHHPSLYGLRTFKQIQAKSKSASVVFFVNSVGLLVCIKVCPTNNFLAGVVHILSGCDLSLGGSFPSTFHFCGGSLMSLVLGKHCFFKYVSSLCLYSVAFMEQLCDRASAVFSWNIFKCWKRLNSYGPVPLWFDLSIQFLGGIVSSFSVCFPSMNDRSLSSLGTVSIKTGTAAFFEDIHLGLGIRVSGIVSSTLAELQAIALALECIPLFCSVDLFSDSQAALNACKSESLLIHPDFRNQCWIEHCHITDVIQNKNLNMNWVKIKGHSGVLGNKIGECFLRSSDSVVFGNLRHFVHDVFRSVVVGGLRGDINWSRFFLTYFIKTLHHQLPVVMHKCLYDRHYPSMTCLFCGDVKTCSGLSRSFFCVSQLLSTCTSDVVTGAALCKGFVFRDWYQESVSTFKDPKVVATNVVNFVCNFCIAFQDDIWLVHVKHHAVMEKNRLIPRDGSIPVSVFGFFEWFLFSIVRLLGVAKAFGISFRFYKSCLFFSGTCDKVLVHIGV